MRARQKLSKPVRRANGRLGHRNDGLGRERGPSIDSFVWPPASPFIVPMRNSALEILTVSENTFLYRFYAVQPSSLTVTISPRLKKEKLKCIIPGIRHLSSPQIPGKSRPGWPEGTKTLFSSLPWGPLQTTLDSFPSAHAAVLSHFVTSPVTPELSSTS